MTQSGSGPEANNVYPLNIADATRSLRHVFVRDLDLEAVIGIHVHEKKALQPIRINVDLTVSESREALGDQYVNVVCYETVVRNIQAIIDSGHVNLVETLAEQVAQKCLEDQRVLNTRVRIEKLAAIPEARSVGVEIERRREG